MFDCLPAWLVVCLLACVLARLLVCVFDWTVVFVFLIVCVCLCLRVRVCSFACLLVCFFARSFVSLFAGLFVCSWLRGVWSVKFETYRNLVRLLQQLWCRQMKLGLLRPAQRHMEIVNHVYREHNREADAAAGAAVFNVDYSQGDLTQKKFWKMKFDGSYKSETGSGGGVVVRASTGIKKPFCKVLTASVPVEADSAVQAELLAAVIGSGITHMLLNGGLMQCAIDQLRAPRPSIYSISEWWKQHVQH